MENNSHISPEAQKIVSRIEHTIREVVVKKITLKDFIKQLEENKA
jgi:hypothetical protein